MTVIATMTVCPTMLIAVPTIPIATNRDAIAASKRRSGAFQSLALSAARDNGVRVGSGSAIGGGESFIGLEPLPEFPLLADFSECQV
jgi:hypothetical protein